MTPRQSPEFAGLELPAALVYALLRAAPTLVSSQEFSTEISVVGLFQSERGLTDCAVCDCLHALACATMASWFHSSLSPKNQALRTLSICSGFTGDRQGDTSISYCRGLGILHMPCDGSTVTLGHGAALASLFLLRGDGLGLW
jgi:hypothetical protein